ncbi:MAG: hypothetical protein ACRD11_09115 [Terriglobia bacterium]
MAQCIIDQVCVTKVIVSIGPSAYRGASNDIQSRSFVERIEMSRITGSTSVREIVRLCPSAWKIFDRHSLKGCGGEN